MRCLSVYQSVIQTSVATTFSPVHLAVAAVVVAAVVVAAE